MVEERTTRRTVLGTIVGGVTVLLSGCSDTGGGSLGSEDGATGESEPQNGTDSDPDSEIVQYLDQYRTFLSSEDIQYTTVTHSTDPLQVQVAYISQGRTDQELATEIGTVAGGFMSQLEEELAATRLDATIQNEAEEPVAKWYFLAEWYEEFRNGEITDQELSARFLNTLEVLDSN